MPLPVGTILGHYEILAPIGAGGMGEVYRARDTKLKREVALKVLPEAFASDPERMMRFQREAEVLASLNHPNIAQIYGVEERALVIELVEGESPRGPIPFNDAWKITQQIADALDYAHEKSIVHRDLKPANIKVTPDGTVKLLDFGLAKAFSESTEAESGDSANSPTLTMGASVAGVILGTALYMSPEQARGRNVDKRADIWSFGVVFYELLTGKHLFKGEDLTETLASVVKDQPDLSAAPACVRKLLDACLQKDPKKRVQAIGDVRYMLEAGSDAAPPKILAPKLPWIAAAALALLAAVLGFILLRETPAQQRSVRLSVPLPENSSVSYLEISPDGLRLAMVLVRMGQSFVNLRTLNSDELQPLPGTAGARMPFWSPDGRFLGFFADGTLKVIPATGGPAQVLCRETGIGYGGTWNRNGVILFATENGPLRRVSAKGGECSALGKLDPNDIAGLPVFLPDGVHFFYLRQSADAASSGVYLANLDEPGGQKVLADLSSVAYSPPIRSGGQAFLLFLRESTLMAQPFDDVHLQPVGDSFAVARGSNTLTLSQVAASASTDGTLAYFVGRSRVTQLTWFDRSGKELGKVGPVAEHRGVALSPDGNAATVVRIDQNGSPSLWLYDLVRGSESLLTPPGSPVGGTVWSPLGGSVWILLTGPEGPGLYQKDLKSVPLKLLEKVDVPQTRNLSDWSRDGRFLLYTAIDPKTRGDIWYVPVESGKPATNAVKFLGTDASESQGQLSPDGRWLAYCSDETSKEEIYIRPFPTGPGEWKVSVDGGMQPRWRGDGQELYFVRAISPTRLLLMAATVKAAGREGVRVGTPERLFELHANPVIPQRNSFAYSPSPDGQRFLVNTLVESGQATVNVITNWQNAVAEGRH